MDVFGWYIVMDELIDSFYVLIFDSLIYENKVEVMDFIKVCVDKMMGFILKDIKEVVFVGLNFVVVDMLEAVSVFVEVSKEEDFKLFVELFFCVFNLVDKVEGVVVVDLVFFEND